MLLIKKLLTLALAVTCLGYGPAFAQETPPDIPTDEPTDSPVDKNKIKSKVRADFFLDFDFGEEIINLTPHQFPMVYEAASDTLIYGDFSGGFRVTKYAEISAGLGVKWTFYFPNRTGLAGNLWAYVGLMPYAGRSTVSHQFQPTLQKAISAKSLKIPLQAADFATWTEEDSVNFASSGGLIFSAGVGAPGVNFGVDYIVEGTFATYVEKVSANEVYVMLSTINAKSLNMQVNATLASVGVSKYKEVEQAMAYLINYTDPTGAQAYNDLIRGNVAAIQRLVADARTTAVQPWEKMTRTQVRRMKHFTFGVPFIMNWGWTSGKIYEFSDTKAYYDNTRAEVDYGVFVKEKRRKIFGAKAVKTESFYGLVFKMFNEDEDLITKYISGQYSYNADDNKTDTGDMRKTIRDLQEKTGFSEQLAVNIPGYEKLKFSRISLEVNFDEDHTLRFMNSALRVGATEIAKRASQISAHFTEENSEAAKNLVAAAQAMKVHYESGNDKEFSMAYAHFGKAMLKNASMFQTILQMAGPGVEIVYDIKNTYFSSYRIVYSTTETAGVYRRMATGLQDTWVFANENLNNIFKIAAN
jgi:hypothetical protein